MRLLLLLEFVNEFSASSTYSHQELLNEQLRLNTVLHDLYKTHWNELRTYSLQFAEIGRKRFKRGNKAPEKEQHVFGFASRSILGHLTDYVKVDNMWTYVGKVSTLPRTEEPAGSCANLQGFMIGMVQVILDRTILVLNALKNTIEDSIQHAPCKSCAGAVHLHAILPQLNAWLVRWQVEINNRFYSFLDKYSRECGVRVTTEAEGIIRLVNT